MITQDLQHEVDRTIAAIEADDLADEEAKAARIARVRRAADACNGLTPEERIEAIAQNSCDTQCALQNYTIEQKKLINAVQLQIEELDSLVREDLQAPTTWKEVIYKGRRCFVIIAAFVTLLLLFRPQIADVLGKIAIAIGK
ncbi:MAG: hypothetical protein IJT88_02570 [Kiritimatiellae bacterium]|nr:hypothetical protein [Kiritimatiellia bacterium]